MSKEIYYFSGTGNSFIIARDIANKINAELIPVASIINQNSIYTEADVIGFVFPIYDFKPPKLVIEFAKKLRNIDSKYIFVICTYGIAPLKVIKIFDRLIQSKEGKLSSGFAVKMPHNGLGSSLFSKDQHEKMFMNWKIKLEKISEYIISGKKGRLETSNIVFSIVLSGLLIKRIPFIIKFLKQVIMKGWGSLSINYNERCDGCGICEKICPVDNIKMVDNKPLWLNNSEGCFACYHWCPKEAIQFGKTNMNIKQYHHPEVRIVDIMRQKRIDRKRNMEINDNRKMR